MTARDRTVILVVGLLVAVVAAWFLLLAPKRSDAKDLDAKISAAQGRLDTAKAGEAAGQAAAAGYRKDYAVVARLGKAVPADDDVPSLVVQLQAAAGSADVDFRSIELSQNAGGAATPLAGNAAAIQSAAGSTGATGSAAGTTGAAGAVPATQTAAATLPPGASVGSAGFPTLPFDFAFNGSFFRLQDFLGRLDAFTKVRGDKVKVRGRLLTVDGFSLKATQKGFPNMQASIHATAYIVPAAQGIAAGATPTAPAAVTPATQNTANPTGGTK